MRKLHVNFKGGQYGVYNMPLDLEPTIPGNALAATTFGQTHDPYLGFYAEIHTPAGLVKMWTTIDLRDCASVCVTDEPDEQPAAVDPDALTLTDIENQLGRELTQKEMIDWAAGSLGIDLEPQLGPQHPTGA